MEYLATIFALIAMTAFEIPCKSVEVRVVIVVNLITSVRKISSSTWRDCSGKGKL